MKYVCCNTYFLLQLFGFTGVLVPVKEVNPFLNSFFSFRW